MTYGDMTTPIVSEDADHLQNDSRTCEASDTGLTHDRSGFDLTYEDDRRSLHHARNKVDAQSADGHTYSNILELRENWEKSRPGDFCRQHIPRQMKYQANRLVARSDQ